MYERFRMYQSIQNGTNFDIIFKTEASSNAEWQNFDLWFTKIELPTPSQEMRP